MSNNNKNIDEHIHSLEENENITTIHTALSPLPPPSAYVDYTPRHNIFENEFIPPPVSHLNEISILKEKREQYFKHLVEMETGREYSNYMDSPVVRRDLGVNPNIAQINDFQSNKQIQQQYIDKTTWIIEDFDVGKHLGTGKFGNVYMAKEKSSEKVVALKILIKKEIQEANVVHFLKREVEIHSHLRHRHILRMYGYFQDDQHVYLVLDCASKGSLYQKLDEYGRFNEKLASKCIYQVATALQYLHNLGIIHRDLKPENVLIDDKGSLKLADFGWAVHDRRPRRKTFCGTLDYLPPEMIENRNHTAKVDIWALGVMAFELIVGKPPFEHAEYVDTYKHIVNVDFAFPKDISHSTQQFINMALQHDDRKRSDINDLLSHTWIKRK
ncbi:aurora kinase A [Cunninghamella echinulata]|nr:aurora kinase A [Cunninghamella echinulata]